MNQTVFTHNGFPKVGIRPIIDGWRRGKTRHSGEMTLERGLAPGEKASL